MKVKSSLLLICILITGFSCEQINDLLTFNVKSSTSITIPASSPLSLPFEMMTPEIQTGSSQDFENNNTRADLVKDVKLEELKMTITAPEGKTFSFLKSIQIYISAENKDEILLASAENISSATNTISLATTQEKLDEYIKANGYRLRTKTVTRETLTRDVTIKIDMKYKVTADVL
ncbi:MAG: hypothetical protein VB102_10080 [Paludibacter sp.]|nr:hypothetical protein [Paludibacter sp.]